MSRGSRRASVSTAVLIVVLLSGAWCYQSLRAWLAAPIAAIAEPLVYEVPRGATLTSALNELGARGLITHPRLLALWTRYARVGFRMKAGEYQLDPGLSPSGLIELFNSGRVLLHKITIVEGTTFAELQHSLAAESLLRHDAAKLSNAELLKKFGSEFSNPEGLFFPDTYRFAKGDSDLEILQLAYQRMHKELDRVWSQRDANLPLTDAYQALILASIVEKETALASERPLIAGVFIERLRKGMRLQTDPTVIYGMQENYDGNIRRADLLRDTPYNTYTRVGLPPTPICFPSEAAIDAAVHPQTSDALFFVATGKGDGSHYFSHTLEEHNAAVQRYLQMQRQNQQHPR